MPRERTYTDTGYIETQWSRSGELVCVEAADITSDGRLTDVTFHQFTHPDELSAVIRALKRARRQAFDT